MTKMWITMLIAAFAVFAWLSLPTFDQAQAPGVRQQTASGTGTVLALDTDKGIVTISHGPLPALNMMPMTMSYVLEDRKQIEKLQPMQKVEFRVVYDGNDYRITEIK